MAHVADDDPVRLNPPPSGWTHESVEGRSQIPPTLVAPTFDEADGLPSQCDLDGVRDRDEGSKVERILRPLISDGASPRWPA